ncbi:uncharacterized protein LOC100274986 [Zea mays]|uniref:Uncharacterized protein n=1 Tax=Zea mays TaxID=4577 RepID=B6SM47_MAIZE|nr:uncharacterized protein LOC100274986 [Zea mays]ACG25930.1 hypothetical protein [Zea mays]|eukprot:NP_001142686.1 uncharacterized protein LOC100274986 [Zea mays]
MDSRAFFLSGRGRPPEGSSRQPRLLTFALELYVQKSNFAVRRLSCYPSLGRHQTSEVATEYLFPEPRSGGKKAKATADQAPKIRVSSGHLWREWQARSVAD